MALRLRIDGSAPVSRTQSDDHQAIADQLSSSSTISPSTRSNGKLEVDSINEGISETATEAAAAVLDLRKQQLGIVKDSSERAYGDGTIARQEQAETIQAEIERITSNATYNGVSVLSGQTLTLDENGSDLHDAIGLASFASEISTEARLSDQTPENALSDVDVLKAATVSIEGLIRSYSDAEQQTKDSGEPRKIGFDTPLPQQIRDSDQARELARKIAASVATPYATERQKAALIDMSAAALDQNKVYSLIA